jgi:hypothetical protein
MFKTNGGVTPLLFLVISFAMSPQIALACACGCGLFDVGTASVLPTGPGGSIWTEYDFVNQSKNRSGASYAPDTNNDDKDVRTNFYTLGAQYMFNRDWGVRAAVPYANRAFQTTDDSTGDIATFHQRDIGDIRINGIYSGFSPDMSTGLTFGLKLPTGDYDPTGFDRDTALGTGSTDVLLGAYTMGRFAMPNYGWFANGVIDQPFLTTDHYRPGTEINAAIGTYREGWKIGKTFTVTPILQMVATHRWHDEGLEADEEATGYTRLMASPGIEFGFGNTKLYTDVEVPFYEDARGNQLVAPEIFKVMLKRDF